MYYLGSDTARPTDYSVGQQIMPCKPTIRNKSELLYTDVWPQICTCLQVSHVLLCPVNSYIPVELCLAQLVYEESSGHEPRQALPSIHSEERWMPCYCLLLMTELSHLPGPFSQSNKNNHKNR